MLRASIALGFALCLSAAAWAQTPPSHTGSGSVTRPANTNAYSASELLANNTTGSAVATPVFVTGTNGGSGLIFQAELQTSNTGASAPPTITVYLFSGTPTTTGLADQSTYIAPYAADIKSGIYLGALTCASWAKTNDGTAQWATPCSTSNSVTGPMRFQAVAGQMYVNALFEVGGSYTPISGEVETLLISTLRDN